MTLVPIKCLWAVAVVAVVIFPSTTGCRCAQYVHLQNVFCQADYVLEIVVTGNTTVSTEGPISSLRYDIKTSRVYKTTPRYERLTSKDHAFTGLHSCAVFLEEGVRYLILGSLDGTERLELQYCTFGFTPLRADGLTHEQQSYLDYGYQENCGKCEIKDCRREPNACEQRPANNQSCTINGGYQELKCYQDFALCKNVQVGLSSECLWSDRGSGRLNGCLEDIPNRP